MGPVPAELCWKPVCDYREWRFHEENGGASLQGPDRTGTKRSVFRQENWWTTRFAFTEPLPNNLIDLNNLGKITKPYVALPMATTTEASVEAEHGDLKADLVELDEFEHEDMTWSVSGSRMKTRACSSASRSLGFTTSPEAGGFC